MQYKFIKRTRRPGERERECVRARVCVEDML